MNTDTDTETDTDTYAHTCQLKDKTQERGIKKALNFERPALLILQLQHPTQQLQSCCNMTRSYV